MKTRYCFPDDMERIIMHLSERGDVLIDGFYIEKMYGAFSYERYCAGWMEVTDEILEEFEDWMEYEVSV